MRIVLILCLIARVAAAAPNGFDHNVHSRDIAVAAKDDLTCARCHTGATGLARPGHDACFGSGCHGDKPAHGEPIDARGDTARAAICAGCHTDATHAFYPPYDRNHDFALALGHNSHDKVACTQCHSPSGKPAPKRAAHDCCNGCHDGKDRGPAMTSCATCHMPGIGQPEPPRLLLAKLQLDFSHDRHAARGGAGKACTTCHAEIPATDDSVLPRPTRATCAVAGCHDGGTAFATTVACTKCHSTAPVAWKVYRTDTRFSHDAAAHAEPMKRPCGACHPLATTGEPLVIGHDACADAGCHQTDFAEREPKICSSCHNGTEPWRKLVADRPPAPATELGATLDHRLHPGKCEGCHSLTLPSAQLRPVRGHAACSGSGCHQGPGAGSAAGSSAVAPTLATCAGCHRLGLAATRRAQREAAAWSVRAKFDHAPHATGTTCASCHTDVGAGSVLDIATPTKAACVPCHDGKAAFKLTGTTCKRCHS